MNPLLVITAEALCLSYPASLHEREVQTNCNKLSIRPYASTLNSAFCEKVYVSMKSFYYLGLTKGERKVKNARRYFCFFRLQSQIAVWALKRMRACLIRGYCMQSLGSFRRFLSPSPPPPPPSGKFCQV